MARPERNTVDYFPFICQEGKKMFYIEQTYGNDGYATFVKLLRELALSENHYLNLSEPTTLMFLSAKCRISKETLEAIINDLVNLGKFDKLLWSENKVIWCQDFVDNIQDAYKKRNNKCITFEGLLLLLISLGIRKPSKSKSQVPDNTHSIVEYTIIEDSIEENRIQNNIDVRKLKFSSTLKPFLDLYGKDFLNDFYLYWTETNKSNTKFKMELEKTWSLERRLQTWAKNDKYFNNGKQQTNKSNAEIFTDAMESEVARNFRFK